MNYDRQEWIAANAKDIFAMVMESINLLDRDDDIRADVARAVIRLIWERLISPLFRSGN